MMTARSDSKADGQSVCPVTVVYGDDRRRVWDQVEQVLDRELAGADPQLALSRYEGDQVDWATVSDELRTLPFLGDRRIVLVKDADGFITKYRQLLEAYMDSPSRTGVLVLMAQKFPGTTRLAKKAASQGKVIQCSKVPVKQLGGFLTDYAFEQYRLRLDRNAASMLIELGGDDSSLLMGEIDKIAAYLGSPSESAKAISPDVVQLLVGNNRSYNVFSVIDCMSGGDTAGAISRLGRMLETDRSAEYTAVGAFGWHFRRLYQARSMMEHRVDDREIIRELRVWSRPDYFMRQVKRLSLRRIGAMLRQLTQIDRATKTGSGTVRMGLEKLIVEFRL